MTTVTLSSKFQISVPKDIREAMHFKPGQQLTFLRVGKSLRLVPVLKIEDLFGIAKGAGEFVRDRSTRREDILPQSNSEDKVVSLRHVERPGKTVKSKA
jgi:AbrB family looped-hinge helix DNA binding protein